MQLPPTKVHVWYESADPDDYTGDPIEAVPKGKYTIHCIRWNAVGRYIAEGEMEFGKYPYHHIAHAPGDRTVAQFVVESSIPFRSRAWFRESGAYSTAITEQTWYTNHHMIGEESGACVDVGYQEAIDNFAMWKFDVNGKYTGRSWGLVTTEGGVIYDIQSHECGPDQTDPITIYSALEIEWQAPRTLPSELALEIAIGFSHSYACESYWQYLKAQTYLDRINVAVWRD
jgi:hypothetical protein